MSDESEYDVEPEEFDIYKRKYQFLLDRCEVLQQVYVWFWYSVFYAVIYLYAGNETIHFSIIGKWEISLSYPTC